MGDEFHKIPATVATKEDIIKQFDLCNHVKVVSRESALLQLGRVAEWWLLQALDFKSRGDIKDLIRHGEISGVLNKNQAKLFNEIRTNYNVLKHDTRFVMASCDLDGMLVKFSKFLTKGLKNDEILDGNAIISPI